MPATMSPPPAVRPLTPLLEPRSIAVIGASDNAARIGGMALSLMRDFGYAGDVYPINPKYDRVFGYRCYPDIESLPQAPDLVVLALPASDVSAMLERCAARGARAVVVYAAGFAEAGAAGAALQTGLEAVAARTGLVVAGPKCMGLANLDSHAYTAFASTFRTAPAQTEPGRASIVTQSGNVCSALFSLLRERGVPVRHFINTGNEACVDFADYLDHLADDAGTGCVVGYVEELRDGPRFIDAAMRLVERDRPLILYKAGESERGAAAVRSHTAALAGDLAIYRAAFRQLNVIAADDFAQMADLAWLTGFSGRRAGLRVAVMTMSGAMGAILADKLCGAGLVVPVFDEALQQTLRQGIPDYGMVSNPVDLTGNVVNDLAFVQTVFDTIASRDDIDVIVLSAYGYLLDRMADALLTAAARTDKLFVAVDTGVAGSRQRLNDGGVPVFDDVGRFVRALAPLARWHAGQAEARRWVRLRRASARPATSPGAFPTGPLDEREARRRLAPFGLAALPERVATEAAGAVAAARELGYPVALKILSADIAHKTDVGGVVLGITDEAALRAACAAMLTRVAQQCPTARRDGFLLQPMQTGAVAELIVGVNDDPVFGLALTLGLGGVLTELFRDAAHRLLPIDRTIARQMLTELKSWPLLDGYRGRPLADVEAALDAVLAVVGAADAWQGRVEAIEINPLSIKKQGEGAVALDALVTPRRPE